DTCQTAEGCGIDFGDCSDGVARMIKCSPTPTSPMKCTCVQNGTKIKSIELDVVVSSISLEEVPGIARQQCGWNIR
ncbi:MAG: hypothetical protein AAF449_07230, partial [Myxococcota bacterium]